MVPLLEGRVVRQMPSLPSYRRLWFVRHGKIRGNMRELQADSNQVGKPLAPDGLKTSGGVAKVLNPRALRRLRRRFVNKVVISDVFEQSQHGSIFRRCSASIFAPEGGASLALRL